ncbi:MAG: replication initiation factor domain-containing protein [Candidatus Hodarchaeales archaeon]
MKIIVSIDTLYLHVKYPKSDIYDYYFREVSDVDTRILKKGYVSGDFVIKNGANGYKVSVWKHDARAFLTDQVDEKCGEGKGMGIWIQLGPKFLLQHANELHQAVYDFILEIGVNKDYPITITRFDLAIDCLGLKMNDQNLNYWKEGWVGRSKISKIFYNSRTGRLETICVGSRKSPIFLRVYDKIAQSIIEGDSVFWNDVWNRYNGSVTRVEWEVKPKKGNFPEDLKYFKRFNGLAIRELMNYLLDWGRLCVPNPSDSNRNRWKEDELWVDLRSLVKEWLDGVDWPTSRYGKEFHGTSEAYLKFLSGAISGGMARLNPNHPSIIGLLQGLADAGEDLEKILRKANLKAEVIKRL